MGRAVSMTTMLQKNLTSTKQQNPPIMGRPVSMTTMLQKKLALYTMSPFGNSSAQLITGAHIYKGVPFLL